MKSSYWNPDAIRATGIDTLTGQYCWWVIQGSSQGFLQSKSLHANHYARHFCSEAFQVLFYMLSMSTDESGGE